LGPAVVQRVRAAPERRRRTLSERIFARAPALYRLPGSVFAKLRPSGRLRRGIVRWQLLSAWAAPARDDWDLLAVRYAREIVYEYNPELVTLGLPERVEGWDNWRQAVDQLISEFEETRYRLDFILDFGDHLLTLGRATFVGRASGASIDFDYCQVIELRGALAVHERDFTDWAAALSAAGLKPQVRDSLERMEPGMTLQI
jgi:hypothetical protein